MHKKPADLRLNAVLKLSYRRQYEEQVIQSHFDKKKLGFSAENSAKLMCNIYQSISEDVKRASFRLTGLKKFEHLVTKSETFFVCNLENCNDCSVTKI